MENNSNKIQNHKFHSIIRILTQKQSKQKMKKRSFTNQTENWFQLK